MITRRKLEEKSFSEYTIIIKSVSDGKESRFLEFPQATYTDNALLQTVADINEPTKLTLIITTESGVGFEHEIRLNTTDVVPIIKHQPFVLYQQVDFEDLKAGGWYQFIVTAFSKGTKPMTRTYKITEVAFPDVPVQYSYSPTVDTTYIDIGFYVVGVYHGWYLK